MYIYIYIHIYVYIHLYMCHICVYMAYMNYTYGVAFYDRDPARTKAETKNMGLISLYIHMIIRMLYKRLYVLSRDSSIIYTLDE